MLIEMETRLSRHRTLRARLMLLAVAALAAILAGALLAQTGPVSGPVSACAAGGTLYHCRDRQGL
jgi:3-oxoacyl-(acyl-carrier-protein) synthase